MSNWTQTKIDLGTLRVNQVTEVIFNYIGTKEITQVQATCGCSKPIYNPEVKQLVVKYTPNPIPPHILFQNKHSYHSDKYILVTYQDGTIEKLTFTATIIK